MCDLWEKANNDFKVVKLIINSKDRALKGICCYHIQQCIEKCLKYVLDMKGIKYKYKHDLTPLVNTCLNLGVRIPETIQDNIDTLTDWESSSRYDANFDAIDSDIEELIIGAEELLKNVKELDISSITIDMLKGKLLTMFPSQAESLDDLINEINSSIPPKALNSYGKNKIERVYNFANIYASIFGGK